jgi:hypothetical protein
MAMRERSARMRLSDWIKSVSKGYAHVGSRPWTVTIRPDESLTAHEGQRGFLLLGHVSVLLLQIVLRLVLRLQGFMIRSGDRSSRIFCQVPAGPSLYR